jgi:hypothetical protein
MRWTEGREALIAASDDDNDVDNRVEFGEASSGKIIEKLNLALGEMENAEGIRVEEISLDNRAMLVNGDKVFVANFAVTAGGQYLLDPPSEWEQRSVPKTDAKPPAPVDLSDNQGDKTVVPLYDESTPEGRVRAARQARRQRFPELFADSH